MCEREGTHGVEEDSIKSSECGLVHGELLEMGGGGAAETAQAACRHISCTLERSCLLIMDASETQLHVPSPLHCRSSTSFPPIPHYIMAGTALLGCVR